jgi:hypothetical protein
MVNYTTYVGMHIRDVCLVYVCARFAYIYGNKPKFKVQL